MHSILIIGQSNMAGRGYVEDVSPITNKNIFVLKNGIFRPMFVPVNPDIATSGISLAESFADLYSRERGVEIGIIPCADGGSSLNMWQEGSILFDHACYMASLASRTSEIVGVLWHQGESDSSEDSYGKYGEKLRLIFDALRERLGLYDTPFIVGGLGDFLVENPDPARREKFKYYYKVNEALENMAKQDDRVGFASAKGLDSNPDYLHFSAVAQREFGERYYREFVKLERSDKVKEIEARQRAKEGDLESL